MHLCKSGFVMAAVWGLLWPATGFAKKQKVYDQEKTVIQASPLEIKAGKKLDQNRGLPGEGNRAELLNELRGAKLRDSKARTRALHDYRNQRGSKMSVGEKHFRKKGRAV